MELDFSEQIKDLVKNSKRNSCVSFSECISSVLEAKTKEHNEENESKITSDQLKKVYRRGSAVYSHAHLINKTRGQLALARVNNFLKLVKGREVSESYRLADKDIVDGEETYYVESAAKAFVAFTDLELDLACIELIKAGIEKWDQNFDCFDLEYTEEENKTIGKPFKMLLGSSEQFGVFVKNPENGKTLLVNFESGPSMVEESTADITSPDYWRAKFWTKKPISESISSDAVEWDDNEVVTQWYWDESSFTEYDEIFKIDPDVSKLIHPDEKVE